MIHRDGVYPYAFPRELRKILHYARNRANDVRYHPLTLVRIAPFLLQYWYHSEPTRHAAIAQAYATLIEHSVDEHRLLSEAARTSDLISKRGWIGVFRDRARWDQQALEAEQLHDEFGFEYDVLDEKQLRILEPSLTESLCGGVRFNEAYFINDPGALVSGYARYFEELGGEIFVGDGNSLAPGWTVQTLHGSIRSSSVVVAMGPWSDELSRKLGYHLPLAVKRGYHMHYAVPEGVKLNHPVLDAEIGYLVTPMSRGIRLTTGVELADRDAEKTPAQLWAVEPYARRLLPLGERLDPQPWMGSRPCTPDMLPIIGPANRHDGLYFAFGHGHHGLTLGPVTGRLLAEMMTSDHTFIDPRPFSVERFL
ncbi:D-amino-acid dehydrogenase [Paraburkholderia diazotrophica]|uniref:D-amino-acid dehydrogenase n=2 Tax=Paraburkholderia diazotrophica TaxID=667676 RepID=A0A1H7EJB1_9BURK|nr:D-amino-acid dehydrogenase [Paraburkholderia diazotrophica]